MCVADAADGGSAGHAPVDCDPAKILCKRVAPNCPAYQAPRVVDGCYGDCTPIESCMCETDSQCPQVGTYYCSGRLGLCLQPYV
jgi:hypothetical protein